jgi:CheY-specific phosphatase CheX
MRPAPVPAELVNILTETVVRLLKTTIGVDAQVGAVKLSDELPPAPMVLVRMDLIGAHLGPISWTFGPKIAEAVACKLLLSESASFPSEEVTDAVAELSNIIVGNAAEALIAAGFPFELTPPDAELQLNLQPMRMGGRCLGLQVKTSLGDIHLLIGATQPAEAESVPSLH